MHILALFIGFILDLCIGDPEWIPHPVRWMGRSIRIGEKLVRRRSGGRRAGLLAGGLCMAMLLPCLWGALCLGFCSLLYRAHWLAGLAAESFCCCQMLAVKDLKKESEGVWKALQAGSLLEARKAVARIVGRDTDRLDEAGVVRAAVETVAENFSDGVLAPMLFMAVAGAPGGYVYKCINTLDSMIGYKDPQFLFIGRFAAKLDDLANYLPSRIAAFLLILACPLSGLDMAGAYKIWRRDRRNHASPNSAQTEAAAAGGLGVRLAGDAWYFGTLYEKPYIGDDGRQAAPADILRVNRLITAASWVAMILIQAVYWGCRL